MSAAVSMTLPGARALLGWWRDLTDLAPRRLWYAHLVLHRVEALVEISHPAPLDALAQGLLVHLGRSGAPASVPELAAALALEPVLVRTLLERLEREGRLTPPPENTNGATSHALSRPGHTSLPGRRERRIFYFNDGRPPLFLPLTGQLIPLTPPGGWRFDLATLENCLTRPATWKQAHGFPEDVVRLVWSQAELDETNWEGVPLDRPEQATLMLVETAQTLVGFMVRPDTWALLRDPVFSLPLDEEVTTGLLSEVPPEAWRQAWLAWCQQRSLPGAEVEACKLEPRDHRLIVRPPARLLDRLRQARSEVLRGEIWLLAGTGRVRPAALVELLG